MSPSMPPRFTHPYCSNHVDGNAVSVGNNLAFLTYLFRIPYVLSLIKGQLLRISKFVQRMLHVSFSADILKVCCDIILFVSVYVVNLTILRSISNKRTGNHGVNCFMEMIVVYSQCHKKIPVGTDSGSENMISVLVSITSQNSTDNCLRYPKKRSYFSSTFTRLTQRVNFIYLRFRQCALRFISPSNTFDITKIADMVCRFKAYYWFPSFHLITPSS